MKKVLGNLNKVERGFFSGPKAGLLPELYRMGQKKGREEVGTSR